MKKMIADNSTYRKPLNTNDTQHLYHKNLYNNYNFFLIQLVLPLMIFDKNFLIFCSSNFASDTLTFISLKDLLMSSKKYTRSKYSMFLVAIIFAAIAIFRYIAIICITTIRLSALFQPRLYCNAINSHRHRKFFRRKFHERKTIVFSFNNVIIKSII